MPQTVAAWAAGAAAGTAGATAISSLSIAYGYGVGVAAAYAGAYIATTAAIIGATNALADKKIGRPDLSQRFDNFFDSAPPRSLVYGRCRVGGPIFYADARPNATSPEDNKEGRDFKVANLLLAIAGHPIHRYESIYLGDQKATLVNARTPSGQKQNQGWLFGNTAPWSNATDANGFKRWTPTDTDYEESMLLKLHEGRQTTYDEDMYVSSNVGASVFGAGLEQSAVGYGIAWIGARMYMDAEAYAGGWPAINAVVQGKRVYDPRLDSIPVEAANINGTNSDIYVPGVNYKTGDKIYFWAPDPSQLPVEIRNKDVFVHVPNNTWPDVFKISTTLENALAGVTVNLSASATGSGIVIGFGYGYRDNVALCLADWMLTPRSYGGGGWEFSAIDMDALKTAANDCDTPLDRWWNDTEGPARYRCGGVILSTEPREQVIRKFLEAMDGTLERINGKWVISAGVFNTPYMTLTDADWQSPLEVSINSSRRDTYNQSKSIISREASDWQPVDLEPVRGETVFALTPDHTANTFAQPSERMLSGNRVRVDVWDSSIGHFDRTQIPAQLSASIYYWVVNPDVSSFQLSLTDGGSPISFDEWGSSGYPILIFDRYLSEDGQRETRTAERAIVVDEGQARLLDKIELVKNRQQIQVRVTANQRAFPLSIGDTVRVVDETRGFFSVGATVALDVNETGLITYGTAPAIGEPIMGHDNTDTFFDRLYYVKERPSATTFRVAASMDAPVLIPEEAGIYGFTLITPKLFRVTGWGQRMGAELGIDLTLVSVGAADWDWNNNTVPPPQPGEDVYLPRRREVAEPTDFAADDMLAAAKDGTIITRVELTWTPPDDATVEAGRYEIEHKLSAGSDWESLTVSGSVSIAHILGLVDDVDYDFRIRSVNAWGYKSDWVEVNGYTVEGKTAAPAPADDIDLSYDSTRREVVITWTDPPDLDLDVVTIWYSTSGGAGTWFHIATVAAGVERFADSILPGYARAGTPPTGGPAPVTHYYLLLPRDTSRNMATTAETDSIEVQPLAAPTGVTLASSGVVTWDKDSDYANVWVFREKTDPNEAGSQTVEPNSGQWSKITGDGSSKWQAGVQYIGLDGVVGQWTYSDEVIVSSDVPA